MKDHFLYPYLLIMLIVMSFLGGQHRADLSVVAQTVGTTAATAMGCPSIKVNQISADQFCIQLYGQVLRLQTDIFPPNPAKFFLQDDTGLVELRLFDDEPNKNALDQFVNEGYFIIMALVGLGATFVRVLRVETSTMILYSAPAQSFEGIMESGGTETAIADVVAAIVEGLPQTLAQPTPILGFQLWLLLVIVVIAVYLIFRLKK